MFCLHAAPTAVVLMLVNDVFNPVQFGKQLTLPTSRLYAFQYILDHSRQSQRCTP